MSNGKLVRFDHGQIVDWFILTIEPLSENKKLALHWIDAYTCARRSGAALAAQKGGSVMYQDLSIDSGSSFMKAHAGQGREIEFPAIVRTVPDDDLENDEIKINSKYYLVGHTAATSLNEAIKTPHIEDGFHGSVEQYVQICYALEKLKLNGRMGKLICSLPYADTKKKDIKRKIRERKKFVWSVMDEEDREHERCVEFDEVHVVAQGIGAMQLFLEQDESDGDSHAIMCIDIGSCTSDLVSVKTNDETGEAEFCRNACRTIENANVNWFKDTWIDNLEFVTRNLRSDKNYDYYNVMRHAIQDNFMMQVGPRRVNIHPAFEETKEDFTKLVKNRLMKAGRDLWEEANIIIFTGGGTHLINFESFNDGRIQRMDQWANVRGQYMMFQDKSSEAEEVEKVEAEAPALKAVKS